MTKHDTLDSKNTNFHIETANVSPDQVREKLREAVQIIEAMQSSKFWKLRILWVRLKMRLRSALGASPSEDLISEKIDISQFTDFGERQLLNSHSYWQSPEQVQDASRRFMDELFCKEGRRHAVISRIEFAKFYREEFQKDPWVVISNSAYDSCESPSITVLITLFNYTRHIEQCLDSVSNSRTDKLPDSIEVIVIDDCSTDNSAEVAETYIRHSNIPMCLVKKKLNTGLADARNTGIQLSRADHIFMLDADNWVYPNCLERLYEEIQNSDYAAVYGTIRRFEDATCQDFGFISAEDWNIGKLVEHPYIDAMAMFSKQALLSVDSYSTNLIYHGWFGWDDYDVWLKLAQKNYTCKHVPEILCSYRVHKGSMINTTNYYTRSIAKHFRQKFADLSEQYGQADKVFGFSQEEII